MHIFNDLKQKYECPSTSVHISHFLNSHPYRSCDVNDINLAITQNNDNKCNSDIQLDNLISKQNTYKPLILDSCLKVCTVE